MDRDDYNKLMERIAADSNGEKTLCLTAGIKKTIRFIGWPYHYFIYPDDGQRPMEGVYERWSFDYSFVGRPGTAVRPVERFTAHWVIDEDDSTLKLMDCLSLDHAILQNLRDYRTQYSLDPGGKSSHKFQISIAADAQYGSAHVGLVDPIGDQETERFRAMDLKVRIYNARRRHTLEEAEQLKAGTYMRRYAQAVSTDRLTAVTEQLYDMSRDPKADSVLKFKLLEEYAQLTGKKSPAFLI